jgi:hypothetical protein
MVISIRLQEQMKRRDFIANMEGFAANYVGAWGRLGRAGPHTNSLTVQYTAREPGERAPSCNFGDRDIIADFKAYEVWHSRHAERNVETQNPKPEGFELTIWKVVPDEVQAEAGLNVDFGPDVELFSNTYEP